ncbi:hypothetical protein U1Q18_050496 [Sarracenia purpurea var. burkii]
MCASREELRPKYQRRTTRGFDDPNADQPESSSSSDELIRALRPLSGSPNSQSQNRGLPKQGTSMAAGEKAGKPIDDATPVSEDSRGRAQISELNLPIKSQHPTSHNPIDDLGRRGENYGIAKERSKFQNPRANSGDSHLGKLSNPKNRAPLSADFNASQKENSEIRKEMGHSYLAQQTGKAQLGFPLFQQFPFQEERDEDERRGGKNLPSEGEHASDTISFLETIPWKKSARSVDRLEESGQYKSIETPIRLANNSVYEAAGAYAIKEGQSIEVPWAPNSPFAACLFPEEERACVVNHTISMGSPSREENQRNRAKFTSVSLNGTDDCPMQVDSDEPKSSFHLTSDTTQQNLSLRKRKRWARQARSISCPNTKSVDPTKRKLKEDAGESKGFISRKQRKLEIENGVPTELQVVLDSLSQTAEAAAQPCRSS